MKNINLLLIVAILSCFMLLFGCVSQKEAMIKQGYPMSYTEGFDDGCHSGNKAGGSLFDQFKKDVRRFESDTKYAQGWSDGFRQCESQQESVQRQTRMAIEQQKLSEQKKQNDLHEQYYLEREAVKGVDTSNFKYLK
ncbi:MAG: hypothetical protein JJV89_05660 [Desulfosarcina sp.]|nr:hypothetical protein [Desulfobacterales bacterium]